MHFGRTLAPFWLPFGSILVPLAPFWSLFAPFWSLFAPCWSLLSTILVKNHVFGHQSSRITCRLPCAPPTGVNFRVQTDNPRPGAGILPQAIEIRSGPEAPRRVGIGSWRFPSRRFPSRRLPSLLLLFFFRLPSEGNLLAIQDGR